jgi:hypothetical protein
MQKTLQSLITDTERELYQSAGPGVQVYAQDRIAGLLNQAYEHCYKQEFWPQFRKREQRTLNGTTGEITAPLSFIADWEDIQHVFRENSDRPLPIAPASFNTLAYPPSSTYPRFIEATGGANVFRVYPADAIGEVLVVGRQTRLVEFGSADTVPFDHLALIHFAAWSYFTDDASNPAAALKHQGLFETRMQKLRDDAFGHAVQLNPHSGYIPDRWYER